VSATDEGRVETRRSAGLLIAALLSVPLGVVALHGLAQDPDFVERWYSDRVFVAVRSAQLSVSRLFPCSLSEILVGLVVAWFVARSVRCLRLFCARKVSVREIIFGALHRALVGGAGLWVAFLLLWGFQHARRPYAFHSGLEPRPISTQDLRALSFYLVGECNRWRRQFDLDDCALLPGEGGVDARILDAYEKLGRRVPALRGGQPLLRRAILSPLLSHLGITGIYSPFTGEAHVNPEVSPWIQPFAACHELAHQKGFAREDEANFIAWQVCRLSEDPALCYSASFVAMSHALSVLGQDFPAAAEELFLLLDAAVLADLEENRRFWASKDSALVGLAQSVNDTYLKTAGSPAGARSYGRMLVLMVAERERGVGY
jgi:hypothetical protein